MSLAVSVCRMSMSERDDVTSPRFVLPYDVRTITSPALSLLEFLFSPPSLSFLFLSSLFFLVPFSTVTPVLLENSFSFLTNEN